LVSVTNKFHTSGVKNLKKRSSLVVSSGNGRVEPGTFLYGYVQENASCLCQLSVTVSKPVGADESEVDVCGVPSPRP